MCANVPKNGFWKNKVFGLQNEFHDNRTRFGGFVNTKFSGLFWIFCFFWPFLGPDDTKNAFRIQNFCHQKVSVWSGNLQNMTLDIEIEFIQMLHFYFQ
jgi:hypothetical protein